jgi:hypothetical protein
MRFGDTNIFGNKVYLTPALIPAFSPERRRNVCRFFWNVVSRLLADARRAIGKRAAAVPSPWGEGQGEGGRKTIFRQQPQRGGIFVESKIKQGFKLRPERNMPPRTMLGMMPIGKTIFLR